MKKIYNSPELMLIELSSRKMLMTSMTVGGGTTEGENGGWAKESTTVDDKNVWNEEW